MREIKVKGHTRVVSDETARLLMYAKLLEEIGKFNELCEDDVTRAKIVGVLDFIESVLDKHE